MIDNRGSGWVDKGGGRGERWTSSTFTHNKLAAKAKKKFINKVKRQKKKKASGDPTWWKYKPLFKSGTYDIIVTSPPGDPYLTFTCVPKVSQQQELFDLQDAHIREILSEK